MTDEQRAALAADGTLEFAPAPTGDPGPSTVDRCRRCRPTRRSPDAAVSTPMLSAPLASTLCRTGQSTASGVIANGRGRKSWLSPTAPSPRPSSKSRCRSGQRTARRTGRRGCWPERFGIGKDTVARIWRDHKLEAVEDRDVQDLERPALRGEARRRRRALSRTRPSGPSCSASTRRPRSRRSTAPSRACR